MQQPGVTFAFYYEPVYRPAANMIDDSFQTFYGSNSMTLGDWVRAELPAQVPIRTVYVLYRWISYGVRVDIYAGASTDYVQNTLCLSSG